MSEAALIGNPNTGKTSLFNILTTSYEYIGNWAGVTVEKKVGQLKNKTGSLTDLPGIYSLSPISKDEGVAADYLLNESPSVLINIVDASQLERNLYLTVQLLEYGKPIIIGLNMVDVAKSRGVDIDTDLLSNRLNIPVVPLVARSGIGGEELLFKMNEIDNTRSITPLKLDYGEATEDAVNSLIQLLESSSVTDHNFPSLRWVALQLLENNPVVQGAIVPIVNTEQIENIIKNCSAKLKESGITDQIPEHIRKVRLAFIHNICSGVVDRSKQKPHSTTEKIDAVLTHPWLGIPLFLIFMFLMFQLTFDWLGNPISDLLDGFISGTLSDWATSGLDAIHASAFTHSLITDGIIAGVGGVLVFMPQIFILFLMISFIEDSGYMARITVMTDKLLEKVGLNGKAIIPFIIGFGCNVPAVMASRSIEQPKERTLTMMLIPLMSCSARLPVYALFGGLFFQKNQALIVLGLYVLGIVLALLLAKLFSSILFKDKPSFFVVELPPYRMPQSITLLRSTWEKGKGFLRKAGTFIFGGSILIWLLTYTGPSGIGVSMDDSFLAKLGGLFSSILAPIGFGTWQAGASLVTGFAAKEIVVSTMNIIYHAADQVGLQQQLSQVFTPLQGLSFMIFVLIYTPCLATVGVIRKETASWKWTMFSVGYALVLAYLISLLVYQGGRLLGFA